jgi:hypothetical protein
VGTFLRTRGAYAHFHFDFVDRFFPPQNQEIPGLQAPQQEQDDYDYQYDADDAAGTVTPAASVRPSGQDAEKYQDQDDQQNGAKTHDLLLVRRHRFANFDSDAPARI